jgi:hypothetical protein
VTSNDEVTAFADAVAGMTKQHWGEATAAATGDLEGLWRSAATQGWFDLGAADALDAALAAARELGRLACPLPLIDGFVAARLLPDAKLDSAETRVLVATGAGNDHVEHVEAAAAATHVLLVPPGSGTAELREIAEVVERPGLAVPAWSRVRLGATTATVELDADRADEAVLLVRLGLAARAMAAAERAHEMAVEHAKTRHQFGKPIGSFGAVQQRTATCQIDVSAGALLLEQAEQQWLAGSPEWTSWAEIAVEHVREAAPRVQLGAHHTLAAIGYFEEHEAPWLFRRVHADTTRLREFPRAAGEFADVLVETEASLPASDLGPTGEASATRCGPCSPPTPTGVPGAARRRTGNSCARSPTAAGSDSPGPRSSAAATRRWPSRSCSTRRPPTPAPRSARRSGR